MMTGMVPAACQTCPRSLAQWFLLFCLSAMSTGQASNAAAQSPADVQEVLRLDRLYTQYKRQGRWDLASQAAEAELAYIRQRRMGPMLELGAIDQLALSRMNEGKHDEALKLYQEIVARRAELRAANEQQRNAIRNTTFNGWLGCGRVLNLLGKYAEALEYFESARDYAIQQRQPADMAMATIDYARVKVDLGETDVAVAELNKVLPILEKAAQAERPRGYRNSMHANALHLLGQIYVAQERFDLSEPYYRQALDVIVQTYGWKHNFAANIEAALGRIYQQQNRFAEADRMYRMALEAYESSVGREHPSCAQLLNNMSRMQDNLGNHAEAEALAREALEIKRTFYGDEHPEVATSLLNLGNALASQKRLDESQTLAEEALAIRRKVLGDLSDETTECVRFLATLEIERGNRQKAVELIDQVLAWHQLRPLSPGRLAGMYVLRAMQLQDLGRLEEAAEDMQRGLEQVELQRGYASGSDRERAIYFDDFVSYYNGAIATQARRGDAGGIFSIIEGLKARSFLDELELANVDLLAGLSDEVRAQMQATENDLREKLTAAEAALSTLPDPTSAPTQGERNRRAQASQRVLQAREALYEHLKSARAASPTYRQFIANPTDLATLEQIQEHLRPTELMLSYTMGGDSSYVLIITHDAVRIETLKVSEADANTLSIAAGDINSVAFSQILLASDTGLLQALSQPQELTADHRAQLAALYRVLVPPSVQQWLADGQTTQCVILPSGSLALLPFEALIVADEASPRYLIDVAPPIAYAPSATVWMKLMDRQAEFVPADEPVLALGDPAYQTSPGVTDVATRELQGLNAAAGFRAGLSRLPFSGREADWVRQHFDKAGLGVVKLVGAQANEATLRKLISGREILHLACHGMADDTYGNLFGALALAPGRKGDPNDDGFLSMAEIYDLPMDGCELAILSACQTNYGPHQQGEGVWALSRGFLVAGARRVVASSWLVDDEAGATLISYFADYLSRAGNNRDYALALRDAKRKIRANERWQHPFYWSSLVLVGPG
jgi:CHAT domain-containing protein